MKLFHTRRTSMVLPCVAVLGALALAGCGHKAADDTTTTAAAPAAEPGAPMNTAAPSMTAPPNPNGTMNGAAPGGPNGTMMNKASTNPNGALGDANITMHVKNSLIADKAVKATDINVDTKSETVVLRGSQATQMAITAANADAKKVEGVKKVVNQLTVKAP